MSTVVARAAQVSYICAAIARSQCVRLRVRVRALSERAFLGKRAACCEIVRRCEMAQTDARLRRSAFAITDTELRLMAAAASMGLRSRPKLG